MALTGVLFANNETACWACVARPGSVDPFSRAPRSRSQVDGLAQSSALDDSKSSPFVDQVVLLPCYWTSYYELGLCTADR